MIARHPSHRLSHTFRSTAVVAVMLLLLLGLSLCLPVAPVSASVAWPAQDKWLEAVTYDWTNLTDPIGDFPGANGQKELDVATGPRGSAFAWTFDGEHLFIRIVLRDSPLHNTVRLQNKFWMAYLNSSGVNALDRYHSDYGIVLDDGGIRTTYADISVAVTTDNVNYSTGFGTSITNQTKAPTGSDPYRYIYPHANYGYMVRVANAAHVEPTGGAGYWYLEFFVPLTWLSVPNPAAGVGQAPNPVQATSRVRIAIGTSTQGNNIIKDLAGLADSLDINYYYKHVALHTDPQSAMTGAGYGVFRETRDDVGDTASGYWDPGETITVSGYGWMPNTPVEARIIGPGESSQVRWSGNVPVSASGEVVTTNGANATWATPADAHAGVYTIQAKDPLPNSEYGFRDWFTITQYAGIDTAAPTTALTAILTHAVHYPVTLQNMGNADDSFSLHLSTPPAGWTWALHVDEDGVPGAVVTEATLPQYGTAEFLLVVTPGASVSPGTTAMVTLTLTSQFDAAATASHTFDTFAVGDPEALVLVDGDQQTAFPETGLSDPLWVRVVDADGYGVPGVSVSFAITSVPQGAAGQGLSSLGGISDMQGNVQTALTLGSVMGMYVVTATTPDELELNGSPLNFAAYAWNGPPTHIVWIGDDEVNAGEAIGLALEVRNADGEPTVVRVATALSLSTSVHGSNPYFEDAELTEPIEAVQFAPGDTQVYLHFRETKAGVSTLLAERTAGEEVGVAEHAILVLAGPAAQLVFTLQPEDAETHATLSPVAVQIQDEFGNPVPAGGEGEIALTIEPSAEGDLLGAASLTPEADGSATFDGLSVSRFGVKVLTASFPGLPSADSDAFTIWGSYLSSSTYSVTPDSPVLRGTELTYTATVANTGNLPTQDLTLTVQIPAGTTYLAAESTVCDSVNGPWGGMLECAISPVAVGESVDFVFTVRVNGSNPDGAELTSVATVVDAWNDWSLPNEAPLLTLVHAPVVQVAQQVWPGVHVAPGDTIYVTIVLSNSGNAPATDVVIRSPVPPGVLYEPGSAAASNGATIDFQIAGEGEWHESDVDDEGAPLPVVAIRWIVPELEALIGMDTFQYRAALP